MTWFTLIRLLPSSLSAGSSSTVAWEHCGAALWRCIVAPLCAAILISAACLAWSPRNAWARSSSAHPDNVGIGSFSASAFKFKKTQEDDGMGYGWQVAEPTLKFADIRQDPVPTMSCTLNIGMPLRTEKLGKISAEWAAETAAKVATSASSTAMHSKDSWTPAAFCKAFKDEMLRLFKKDYEGLGARVEVVGSGS